MINIAYVVSSNYLQHEGILGMKWGRRNGPPYPLKPGAHSAAEVKANPGLVKKVTTAVANKVTNRVNAYKATHSGRKMWGKNPRTLSPDELQARIKRLEDEQRYIALIGGKTPAMRAKARADAGKAFTDAFFKKVGERVGSTGTEFGKNLRYMGNQVLRLPFTVFKYAKNRGDRKREDYASKLAAEQQRKEYEDWMLENRPSETYNYKKTQRIREKTEKLQKEREFKRELKKAKGEIVPLFTKNGVFYVTPEMKKDIESKTDTGNLFTDGYLHSSLGNEYYYDDWLN